VSVTIHIKSNRFPEIAKQFHNEASQVVRKTTFDVEAGAKRLAPVDTGLLRNSIQSLLEGDLTGVVFTNVEYSVYLEYGTRRMSARPFMTPALEAERQPFIRALQSIGSRLK
jgi:HK97 gp10 family phage protein